MAENIGKVVQVIGATVDCEFRSDALPDILNAIEIKDQDKGINLTVEVAMHIGDNVVRCVALSSTDGLVRGMPVLDTGQPIAVPVGKNCLGRVFDLLGRPIDQRRKQARIVSMSDEYIFNSSVTPQQLLEKKLSKKEIALALLELSEDERETIVQHLYADLTFREISELRDRPMGTITSWYHRGLNKLRERLEK